MLGTQEHPPHGLDLRNLQMVMEVNGERVQAARSDAISGDPVQSVVQLCALLAERGEALPAGSVVLAGAATAAHMLKAGDRVRLTVEGRDCEVRVSEVHDSCPVLIGFIALEMLDLVVDTKRHRLIGNPDHGGDYMVDIF